MIRGPVPACLAAAAWLLAAPFAARAADMTVGEFSAGRLDGWEEKAFEGRTRYAIVDIDGRRVLEARSDGTASGLVRKVPVDLSKTPYLTWTWRIDGVLAGLDETTRAGDDYPARVYVVISRGARFWRTKTLTYVWSSTRPEGASWPNAFAPNNVTMLAVRSGAARAGRWATETRNVADDLRRYLGVERPHLDAVAVMTDTDNSRRRATAWYGDIRFTSEPPAEEPRTAR